MIGETQIQAREEYYARLEKRYGGKVAAISNYYNHKTVMLYLCHKCGREFYDKPNHLLSLDKGHICGKYKPDSKKAK